MTSNAPFTRIATFRARPGQGDRLVERLRHAAELLAEASGCEMWLVHRDHEDPHTVRISELWSPHEQCDAALTLPAVSENAAGVMALLDGPPEGAPPPRCRGDLRRAERQAAGGSRLMTSASSWGRSTRSGSRPVSPANSRPTTTGSRCWPSACVPPATAKRSATGRPRE